MSNNNNPDIIIDKLIKKVVKESGKTKKEIKELMEKRKEATHGLLSDFGALYAVAKEFGISLEEGEKEIELTKISEISAQKSCNIAARVKAVYPSKDFKRKDGSSGKLASLVLMDDSGECRLVLWNNSAELAKKISKGDILMIRNAYGKESLDGNVELHATSLTHLTVNPKIDFSLPKVTEKLFKIGNLKVADEKGINLICRVSSYFPPADFIRQDGSSGTRAAFIAEDETGKIRVVLWGENAKLNIKRGDFVKIENAYTKEGLNQELELQVGNLGRVIKTEEKIPSLPKLAEIEEKEGKGEILKINEIKTDTTGFTTFARVINVFSPKQYTGGKFSSLIIADKTGTIRTVLWDEKSNIVNELKKGDAISLKNVYCKANLNQEPEIHVGKFSEITLSQDSALETLEEIERALIKEKKIHNLESNDRYVKITGNIVALDEKKLTYMTCSNCNKKIQNLGMGWYCDFCQEDTDPKPNLVFSFTIEDETGSIRAVSFREQAEKILGMDLESIMNVIGETQDELGPIKQLKDSIINTKISLVGRVRYSNFSDQLEFLVTEVVE